MTRSRSFITVMCSALLAAGCRGGSESDPVPPTVPGSYVYAGRGSTLKKPWAFEARLELTPARRYTLTLDKTIDGKTDSTETTEGSYVVSGNHVIIRDSGQDNPSDDDRKLLIKADSLIAEVGWTAQLFLKGLGAPNLVFVKERSG